MSKYMKHWKNRLFIKRCLFFSLIITLSFFSCNKSSEKQEETSDVLNHEDTSETADTVIEDEELLALPEEESVPLQESVVPEQLRRPQRGEAPRLPEDTVIGIVEKGDAPEESYRFAQETLRDFLQNYLELESWQLFGESTLSQMSPEESERVVGILKEINPVKVRVGSGQTEADESVSFLFRFIGANNWSGGEIYLRQNEGVWDVEDIFLDEPREQDEANSSYRFNFPPYERFF
jgi:hypothetical protein